MGLVLCDEDIDVQEKFAVKIMKEDRVRSGI